MYNFKKNFCKFIFIFFLLFIFIFISAISYSKIMFKNISSNFLRLHIIANSDSTEDQILKYKIRDSVINYMQPYFKNVTNKDDALCILNEHLDGIYNVASTTAISNGFSYPINVSIGNFYFPTKEYESIRLPEGYYGALKIELGNATGQNWWCVMFPSLCIIDTNNCQFSNQSNEILENNLSSEEYSIISDYDKENVKIKFKLIELFENI